MKKVSKLINCIALLAAPSVAFSVFTEKDLHLYVGQAYEQYRFNWESIAAIGSELIHNVVDPDNEMLKQLQEVFISIRDQTFFQRTLSDHFFEDLKSKSKQDNILNFLERIIYCYNKKITFVELKCKLLFNDLVDNIDDDKSIKNVYEKIWAPTNKNSLINIKSLLQCFLKHPELIDKDLDKILNIESYLRQFPEVGFFSYILCDFYASAYLYAKKSTNIEIKAALDWYCDCIINTKDCSSLAVLRFFLLNPELAQDLLYLTQSEEDHGFYPWMN